MSTYKTSSLRLYYTSQASNWELLPHKLFIVDSIEDYLATKTYATVSTFQYQKPQLELSITVDLSQTYAEPLNQSFKYVRIENSDQVNKYYYYFVKNTIWRSKSAVRFDLVLDVLNTFKEGTDYSFKDSTKITREHKDRFVKAKDSVVFNFSSASVVGVPPTIDDEIYIAVSNDLSIVKYYAVLTDADPTSFTLKFDSVDISELETFIYNVQSAGFYIAICKDSSNAIIFDGGLVSINSSFFEIYRNIDYIPENINPLLQCNDAQGIKINHQKSKLNCDWYLLYRNQNNPTDSLVNPVECYIIPGETGIKVDSGYIENARIVPSWLETSKFYYFRVIDNSGDPARSYTLSNGTVISDSNTSHKTTMVLSKVDDKISVQVVRAVYGSSNVEVIGNYITDYITASAVPCKYNENASFWTTTYANYYTNITYPNTFNNSGTYTELDSIEELDRTDSKNIKLIKLPYVPYDFTVSGSTLQIDDEDKWERVQLTQVGGGIIYVLKLKDLNTPLQCSLTNSQVSTFNYLYFSTSNNLNPSIYDLRKGISYESKLFHSEFWQPTFYYDSFAFKVQLEKCYLPYYYDDYTYVNIDFTMTKTINSKFMFSFTNYYLKNAEENYAKYLPIARNNEEVLYNVPYINYIRNGYQYDIKNKNIATISNSIGLGLSVASIGASLLAPSVPLKVAGVVGSIVSMAMSVKNTIMSAVQNENSIKQKMTQYQNQASSVAGSDDVDLMSVYAENRLKYLVYEPNEVMKNMLYNLFFYAGYSSIRLGLPNHNTRLNFDYLECDAVINEVGNIPDDCINELINCFKNGVTYIHKTNRSSNKWDFEQQYENWEKSLGVN